MTVDDGNAAGGSAGREPHTDESRESQETDGRSVGNLELFFDLTFVYAMSQVTHLMLSDISWQGFGRGVLALLALWWAWVCYAWLTNLFEVARVVHTTLIILAMAAMLIAVIALADRIHHRSPHFRARIARRSPHQRRYVHRLVIPRRGRIGVGDPPTDAGSARRAGLDRCRRICGVPLP